jgi:UDP-N-acetylmuramoyl-tripeptide--D-alanyl-D-alanine ligase
VIPLTLGEIAAALGGSLAGGAQPDTVVTGPVVVDSRQVAQGGLFACLRGDNADGHDFAADAVAAGAAAVLASRDVGVPALLVTDVLDALGVLAAAVLRRLPGCTVVGVTGSSGKTSTKDLLAHLVEGHGATIAPVGSFNNEVGLPLTVLRADAETRHLVLEYSARGVGHIAYLCGVAPPRIGIVLNVGTAHLGEFGSREAIAKAKGELVEALPPDGLAVLNADDSLVTAMRPRTRARVVTFGFGQADVRAADLRLDASGRPAYRLVCAQGEAEVALGLYGEHQVPNSLAAAAAALELGVPFDDVVARLGTARPRSRWRMEVSERADGVTVVNDAYNANPESMRAALKALAAISRGDGTGAPRRTWAVLGEMLELGESSGEEHDAIGRLAVRVDVSRLVAVGTGAASRIAGGAALEGSWDGEAVGVPDVEAAVALLRAEVRPGDVVLVKASRAVGLERVAEALLAEPAGEVRA